VVFVGDGACAQILGLRQAWGTLKILNAIDLILKDLEGPKTPISPQTSLSSLLVLGR
jgi:hypothetical protein